MGHRLPQRQGASANFSQKIDLNRIKNSTDPDITLRIKIKEFFNCIEFYININNKKYSIKIYRNGQCLILNVSSIDNIKLCLTKIISIINITHTINTGKIKIDTLSCDIPVLYNNIINMPGIVVHTDNLCEITTIHSNIFRKPNGNIILLPKPYNIIKSVYDYIFLHLVLVNVLKLLNKINNSMFSLLPEDLINVLIDTLK